LALGRYHSCAVLSDGSAKCWGSNSEGQLGYGNTTTIGDNELPSSVGPISISTTPGVTVLELAAGWTHTCALLSDSSVKCWGQALYGQLGYGNINDIGDDELPSTVGPVSITTTQATVSALTAGAMNTCTVLSDATAVCWGSSSSGQLGRGTRNDIGDTQVPSLFGPVPIITLGSGLGVETTQPFRERTCAVQTDGSVKCWGSGGAGELGYGNTTSIGATNLAAVAGVISITTNAGVVVTQLVGGDYFTCVLLSDDTVKCWGQGTDGQLGYGNTNNIGDDELPSSVGPVAFF
ncbi:MAG TPA: hypothetical protein VGM29_09045, partial [Polyangiaceae bacterium]